MLTVKKRYLCGYHCQSCGAFNCEVGEIEAMAKTQADAYKLVQQLFQNIKNTVNQRKKYRMPGIKGTCQKCGTRQVWSGHERKTSVVEKVLFAMTLVTMVLGVLGIFIYQSKFPLFLSCVLTLALIGILLMTMHMFDKAYWESVCKQVDEQLSSTVRWNPYPFVMATDDRADPNDERSVKLAQRMEKLNRSRNTSLSNAQNESTHEKEYQKTSSQMGEPKAYPSIQGHVSGEPMFGIKLNKPAVEFVGEQTGCKMTIINEKQVIEDDLVLLHGNARMRQMDDTSYRWAGPAKQDCTLLFKKAYVLEGLDLGNSINDCVYRIHGRELIDLSFLHGDTLEEYPNNYQIRKHKDGTKFLFIYTSIPTFDFEDRLWDSVAHTAVYRDWPDHC